ncbi:MAG: hypothetical protein IIA67_13560 [Planctomycetes bacterium]|nr:hypothetical protein [Planctomycetota bacterium]
MTSKSGRGAMYLAKGHKAEAAGKPQVARLYYQMASRRGSDAVRIVGPPAHANNRNQANRNNGDAGIASALVAPATDSDSTSAPSQPGPTSHVEKKLDRGAVRNAPKSTAENVSRSPAILTDVDEIDDVMDLEELLDSLVADLKPR